MSAAALWLAACLAALAPTSRDLAAARAGDKAPPPVGQVVILRASRAGAALQEASTRLQAELRASRFQVRVLERHPDRRVLAYDAGAVMALFPRPLAAITLDEADGALLAALWRIDPETEKPEAFRVTVKEEGAGGREPAGPPAVLALRAVELLHASLAGVALDAPKVFPVPPPPEPAPAPKPPPVVVQVVPTRTPAEPPRAHLSLGAGPAIVVGWGQLDPVGAVAIAAAYGRARGLALSVDLVGLSGHARLEAAAGVAEVAQRMALAHVVWRFGGTTWLPAVHVGGGVYRADVTAEARAGFEPVGGSVTAAVLDGGASCAFRFAPRWAITASAAALLAEPALRVRVADVDVGRTGRPTLVASLRLQADL